MARERTVQKKSFQQSLDDIKERMKEKRTRRLASALAGSRSRALKARSSGIVKPLLLKSVQVNNRALAAALQMEREKVRQAQAVVLQLKKERQALVFHLLVLKRTLRERAQVSPLGQTSPVQPSSPRAGPVTEMEDEAPAAPAPPAGPVPERSVSLPPSVGTRRRRRSRASRRRSSRFDSMGKCDASRQEVEDHPQEVLHEEPHPNAEFDPEESDLPAECHSTPEPPRRRARRKQTQAPRPRAERAPLKRPWDKPRPRSKSRERAQSRSTAAAPQAPRLNTSLGGNDTFDFDCEEAVHLTPFRAGSRAPGGQDDTRDETETQGEREMQDELETRDETETHIEMEPDVPKRKARRVRRTTHRDTHTEDCGSAMDERDAGAPVMISSPLRERDSPEQHSSAPPAAPSESPVGAAGALEPMMILSPLFEFPKSPSSSSNQENEVPSAISRRRKGGLVLHSFQGLSDVTNLSPAANQKPSPVEATPPSSARQRRCASSVNYKEPSINSKLRRGDKHTDTRFLRSPIFKQKASSRRSSLKKMEIYNESFVGCR